MPTYSCIHDKHRIEKWVHWELVPSNKQYHTRVSWDVPSFTTDVQMDKNWKSLNKTRFGCST